MVGNHWDSTSYTNQLFLITTESAQRKRTVVFNKRPINFNFHGRITLKRKYNLPQEWKKPTNCNFSMSQNVPIVITALNIPFAFHVPASHFYNSYTISIYRITFCSFFSLCFFKKLNLNCDFYNKISPSGEYI